MSQVQIVTEYGLQIVVVLDSRNALMIMRQVRLSTDDVLREALSTAATSPHELLAQQDQRDDSNVV